MTGDAGVEVRVSVLVATRDRPVALARCLASVLAGEMGAFEVIVVDQSAGPETAATVDEVRDSRVRYVRQEGRGLSRARNLAVELARADVLACTDDDCTVPREWLARILEVFDADRSAGVIFGAFVASPHDPAVAFVPSFEPSRFRRLRGGFATRHNRSEAGGNMAIRREVFARIGGFDPLLGAGALFAGGEDSDFNDRALRAGYVVVHDPWNRVTHWGARPYADGSARRLLLDGSSARGAILAKGLRCGDPVALYRLLAILVRDGASVAWSVARGASPSGGARLRATVDGFARGLRYPLDRRRQVFRQRTPEG